MDQCIACGQREARIKSKGWCLPCYKRWWRLPEPRPAIPPAARSKLPARHCRECGVQITRVGKSGLCHSCWLERDAVRVEKVVYRGITFRRYPDSENPSHREYYKPGGGHIARGVEALHREVYKDAHGPIPPGYHVHHIDSDTSNNDPGNLVALPPGEHVEITVAGWEARGGSWRDREAMLANLDAIRTKASAWHRSEEGRRWHRENAHRHLPRVQPDDQ